MESENVNNEAQTIPERIENDNITWRVEHSRPICNLDNVDHGTLEGTFMHFDYDMMFPQGESRFGTDCILIVERLYVAHNEEHIGYLNRDKEFKAPLQITIRTMIKKIVKSRIYIWNLKLNKIEVGQWISDEILVEYSSLSPRCLHFLYASYNSHAKYKYSTALSKLPWLRPLVRYVWYATHYCKLAEDFQQYENTRNGGVWVANNKFAFTDLFTNYVVVRGEKIPDIKIFRALHKSPLMTVKEQVKFRLHLESLTNRKRYYILKALGYTNLTAMSPEVIKNNIINAKNIEVGEVKRHENEDQFKRRYPNNTNLKGLKILGGKSLVIRDHCLVLEGKIVYDFKIEMPNVVPKVKEYCW
jgi:hypothetical protein